VDAFKNLRRGEMPAIMQGLQDGKSLGSHAVAARTQHLSMAGNAGHNFISLLIIISIRNIFDKGKMSFPLQNKDHLTGDSGITHRLPWKQKVLSLAKFFF
jgi:hypothetical protein